MRLLPDISRAVIPAKRVLRLIETGATIHWANLAASCGYYDQAHFIRDFRIFSGSIEFGAAWKKTSMPAATIAFRS